jgi:hypothetical protein
MENLVASIFGWALKSAPFTFLFQKKIAWQRIDSFESFGVCYPVCTVFLSRGGRVRCRWLCSARISTYPPFCCVIFFIPLGLSFSVGVVQRESHPSLANTQSCHNIPVSRLTQTRLARAKPHYFYCIYMVNSYASLE